MERQGLEGFEECEEMLSGSGSLWSISGSFLKISWKLSVEAKNFAFETSRALFKGTKISLCGLKICFEGFESSSLNILDQIHLE